jgi:hypothetical protein
MPARTPKRVTSPKAAKKTKAKGGDVKKAARPPTATLAAKKAASKQAKPKPRAQTTASNKRAAKATVKSSAAQKPKAKSASKREAEPARRTVSRPARDALRALAKKKVIKATLGPMVDGKAVVDAYMRDVDHPFKVEMEAVRQIVLGASAKISERIKWNAPSFFYKEDLGAFNPRATEYAHLILLFPSGAGMAQDSGLLEGNHKDRREAKFHSMQDVNAKRPALEKLVKRWVALRDKAI